MLPPYRLNPKWTHAGGLAYRAHKGAHEVLLVRARPKPHDWVFPKGHIEKGESPHECARRELREEAGADADARLYLGDDRFTNGKGRDIYVAFFLMRFLKDVEAAEERERRWCTFREARSLITFDSGRALLRTAEAYLERKRHVDTPTRKPRT